MLTKEFLMNVWGNIVASAFWVIIVWALHSTWQRMKRVDADTNFVRRLSMTMLTLVQGVGMTLLVVVVVISQNVFLLVVMSLLVALMLLIYWAGWLDSEGGLGGLSKVKLANNYVGVIHALAAATMISVLVMGVFSGGIDTRGKHPLQPQEVLR
jgi:hypothetical protein